MGTEDNKQYENRYAILCENPCDAFGMLNTLDKIIEPASVVVLDTSLIPTVRKDIERLTIDQARKLWLVYGALNRIFTDNKARIYPAVYSEIESHLGSERAAADSLGRDSDFLRYAQAIDQLSICLSKPAELPSKYEPIFSEFMAMLKFVDEKLEIRNNKRHFNGTPTTVDLENLAYAFTLSVAEPEKHHVLLARDIDYERLFDKTIGLAYSSTFSTKNKNKDGDTILRQLGNPSLVVTYCDEQKKNQPFSPVRETSKLPVGREFNWEKDFPQQIKEAVVHQVQLSLYNIIHSLKQLKQSQEVEKAALPVASVSSISTNDIRSLYAAIRVTGADIAQKHEQGKFKEVLDGYRTILSMAKNANDEQTLGQIGEDLKSIEKYLLVTQKKEAITASNVHSLGKSGELEQMIEQQHKLRETAGFLGMGELAKAASHSLGIAKGYVKKMHPVIKKTANELGDDIKKMAAEIEDLRKKHGKWIETDKYYERLKERLKGEVSVECHAKVIGEERSEKENYELLIFNNLSTLIGHEPAEGEPIGKKLLVQALGISKTSLSNLVRRADVEDCIPLANKSSKPFVFSRQALSKLGRALTKRPQEIRKEQV